MFGQVVSWYVAGMLLVCVTLSYSVLSTINSSRPEHTKLPVPLVLYQVLQTCQVRTLAIFSVCAIANDLLCASAVGLLAVP